MRARLAALALAFIPLTAHAQEAPVLDDPYTWMEEIEGERALAWARAENAASLPRLQKDPRYATFEDEAKAVLTATDRIAAPGFHRDQIDNFWQDQTHVRGVWRRTTLESYRTASPQWKTVLDVDALAEAEKANWVFAGSDCLAPEDRLCLVALSDGGKDAQVVREFDADSGRFVEGGFALPEGKHRYTWVDRDTLIVATDWTPGEVTTSGYPYVVKLVKRGQPLSAATEVFRGKADDGGYGVSPAVLRDPDGTVRAILVHRPLDTFRGEYHLITDAGPVKLDLPGRTYLQAYVAGRVLFTLQEDWAGTNFKAGDLIDFDLAALKRDPATAEPQLVLRPTDRQAIESITSTRNTLVVALYENVKGQALVFRRDGDGWAHEQLDLPKNSSVRLGGGSEENDRVFIYTNSYLEPDVLWLADASGGRVEKLKTLPARFDAQGLTVDQFEATSSDGEKIPYFVVRRKDVTYDGSNPTLLYAYGGFEVSQTPSYSGTVGKLWLERGGVYVVANIRGGGEFGPRWHTAGLKENRQKVFDDYFAVAQDLITRKITSPRRLGAMGGSNGGLLMGVALTQKPELFNAIVIQVPLFDMLNYTHIGAGASWVGEYGDPAIPAERAWIAAYDPYSNLKAGKPYPQVFIETSTKDDRVHPAHARRAGERLGALGYGYLYYE
ncbi:MAG: S9 family peptidase, partial [Caulobacteraceae bacterium]|nr:S9 family peptidase [Caulobacteraceae bacterium]